MKHIKWIVLVILIGIVTFFTWNNQYSQKALSKRVPYQKGFKIIQQKQNIEVTFTFKPSWVPEKGSKEKKDINQLVYQNYNSSIYLTSVYNHYERDNERESIIGEFEIKQTFNTQEGQYLSCYSISDQGFTTPIITVKGYDSYNNPLDEYFGSGAGTGPGETFSIYLRVKELLKSPIQVKFGSLNLIKYIKNS